MKLKQIFSNIKGFFNLERIITYGLLGVATIVILSMATCNKEPDCPDCDEYAQALINELTIGDTLPIERVVVIEQHPEGDTITPKLTAEIERRIRWQKRWIKSNKELAEEKARVQELIAAHEESLAKIHELESDTIKSGQWLAVVKETEELPEVHTTIDTTGEHFTLHADIYSQGQLKSHNYDVQVFPPPPKTITLTKTEVKEVTKKGFLAIKGGYIYYDSRNHAYPFSLQFGRSIFTIEAGPIVNRSFDSIDGWQAQGGIVIKFK